MLKGQKSFRQRDTPNCQNCSVAGYAYANLALGAGPENEAVRAVRRPGPARSGLKPFRMHILGAEIAYVVGRAYRYPNKEGLGVIGSQFAVQSELGQILDIRFQ